MEELIHLCAETPPIDRRAGEVELLEPARDQGTTCRPRSASCGSATTVPTCTPPVDDVDPASVRAGVTAWFVAQVEGQIFRDPAGKPYRTRPLIHWRGLDGGNHFLHDGKKIPVVPVRFVQACRNGHLSDIDWHHFVHAGKPPSSRSRLWIDEAAPAATSPTSTSAARRPTSVAPSPTPSCPTAASSAPAAASAPGSAATARGSGR